MQRITEDLLPPVLFRFARKVYRRLNGLGTHDFVGQYKTMSDVPVYSRISASDNAARAVERGVPALRQPQRPLDDGRGRSILPVVASIVRPRTIVDFGGGSCVGLGCLRAHCPDLAGFSYVLIEAPAIAAAMQGQVPGVSVVDQIPAEVTHPAIVNASGSIQCVNDWRDTLQRLAALRPEFFIISLTPFTYDIPTYAREQTNSTDHSIAGWVFNRAQFTSVMDGCGYRETFRIEHDLPLTHKNSPAPTIYNSLVYQPN